MSENQKLKPQSKKIGLLELLGKLLKKLPCCEIVICFLLALPISIFLLIFSSPCELMTLKELWINLSNISASIASFILAILVLIYGIGGKLNTDYHKNIFPKLTSVISFGILSHLTSVMLSLTMYFASGLKEQNVCMCGLKILTFWAILAFLFSMIYTFNIVFHTYSIHSFFNNPND